MSEAARPSDLYESGAYIDKVATTAREREMDDVFSYLKPGSTLELGCGVGVYASRIGSHVGLDYSFRALRSLAGPGVCATAERLPFRSGIFTNVLSVATLEHVPRPEEAFEEITRVVAPGGRVVHRDAWFCRPWVASGIEAKSWREASPIERLRKLRIAITEARIVRWPRIVLARVWREIRYAARGSERPFPLEYGRLSPRFDIVLRDADAFSSLDPHAILLFYRDRGFKIVRPGAGFWRRLFAHRHIVLERAR